MEIKRGIPVSPGVAIGPALVLDNEYFRVSERFVKKDQLAEELKRLKQALAAAAQESRAKQNAVSAELGKEYGAIFGAHASIIEDPGTSQKIEELIRTQGLAAEYAVHRVLRRHAKMLESMNSARNITDLLDIEKRILSYLSGQRREDLRHLSEPVIVLAHDLTPSETAGLDPKMVSAFATEAGGQTSHTAIMAGALEIPAVVGLSSFVNDAVGGDLVIVDGYKGVLILNPDEETLAHYEKARTSFVSLHSQLSELRNLPAETKDGVRVLLMGNIEFPHEADHCLERGADGVGLYRTEFLYLDKQSDPTEAEHYDAYVSVLRRLGPKPVVIRTLDLGADKFSSHSEPAVEEKNPFLGVRSIRLCLRNLTLFKTQMRAILRASALGDVRIMFPMVSTLLELRQCKMILAEVKEDLEEEGIPFNPKLPLGTMIEVPSAAIVADKLAPEVDFFSIGTNDLIQYTLAADRNNEAVASLYSPGDPAVLRLIDYVTKAANKTKVEVNVCGEMSGDPIYTLLLLGLDIRQLSVAPQNIPEVKKVIRSTTIEEATQVAQEALRMETARDVNNYLREQTRRILPEMMN